MSFPEIFVKLGKVGDKEFIFSGIDVGGEVLALVKEPHSDIYKVVAFRISHSDNQWKSVPGIRKNGSLMKGDESNPAHHYVQSAKLHPDVDMFLESLPKLTLTNFNAKDYIPNYRTGRYTDEFDFKEEYIKFNDERWQSKMSACQFWYRFYNSFVISANDLGGFAPSGNIYKELEIFSKYFKETGVFDEKNGPLKIKTYLDNLLNIDSDISNKLDSQTLYVLINSKDNRLRDFGTLYDLEISRIVRNVFQRFQTDSMTPDFSRNSLLREYIKNRTGKNPIYVEEYLVESSKGDRVVFAMARDRKGHFYIDNIYDPTVGVTKYGTPKRIANMGVLVYKPIDYSEQANFGFPREFLTPYPDDDYSDINRLWRQLPVIRLYIEALKNRKLERNRGLEISTAEGPTKTESKLLKLNRNQRRSR